MLFLFIIIALASVGSSQVFDKCLIHAAGTECKIDDVFRGIPVDPEGLDTFCQEFQNSLRCSIDEYKKCSENQNMEDFLEHVLRYAERSCNKDSEIYKVISSNLQCIESTNMREDDVCESNKTWEFLLQHKDELVERGINEECQFGVLNVICDAAIFAGKCGEDVGLAVLDVFINIKDDMFQCPADVVERLPDVLQAVVFVQEIENAVSNEIKKK